QRDGRTTDDRPRRHQPATPSGGRGRRPRPPGGGRPGGRGRCRTGAAYAVSTVVEPGRGSMTRNARWGRRVLGVAFAAGAAFGLGACEPEGIDLVVNTPVDGSDADQGDGTCEMTPGAGDCSLRAAIDEANALPDHEVITFDAAVTAIELAVPGPGEDA